jgi:hypothetical protein
MILTREEMIDRLVKNDVEDISRWISEGDTEFLTRVLRGDGWKGYNSLTNEEIVKEYKDREFEEE